MLDLTDPDDRATLYRLVEDADIVTESFRTGVTQRLGVDYETLRAINPRLLYLSVSGYGREGPRGPRTTSSCRRRPVSCR